MLHENQSSRHILTLLITQVQILCMVYFLTINACEMIRHTRRSLAWTSTHPSFGRFLWHYLWNNNYDSGEQQSIPTASCWLQHTLIVATAYVSALQNIFTKVSPGRQVQLVWSLQIYCIPLDDSTMVSPLLYIHCSSLQSLTFIIMVNACIFLCQESQHLNNYFVTNK